MFIIELKPKEELLPLLKGNVLFIRCEGCKEVFIPSDEIEKFKQELKNSGITFDEIALDYLCNHEYTEKRVAVYRDKINDAKGIVVFSCGAGVQVVSNYIKKFVQSGCNTIYINGFQGLTPTEFDCAQCGDCLLNYTGGICPVTSCSKSLLNGPCGGAKDGKCEVDAEKECGWQKIYEKLEKTGRLENFKKFYKIRDYSQVDLLGQVGLLGKILQSSSSSSHQK